MVFKTLYPFHRLASHQWQAVREERRCQPFERQIRASGKGQLEHEAGKLWHNTPIFRAPARHFVDNLADDREVPTVSVVIPTWNSAKSIRTTLASIANQTYPCIEVIAVDRFSRDNTELMIRQSFPGATVIRASGERSLQKNTGARSAKGKYLYFVDSDFVVQPGVIAEAVAACESGFEGAIIHNTSDPGVSFWSRVRKLERDTYYRDPGHVAVRFVRKDLFFRVGGFDEDIIAGEDYDFHTRVLLSGARLCWVRGIEFHIGEPKRLTDVVTKHVYYGKNVLNYVRKQFRLRLWQLSPFRRSYVSNMHMFFENPSLLVGFVLYQYVRYASTLAGLLASTLSPATAPHPRFASSTSALDPIQLLQRVSIVLVTRNRASEFYGCVRSLQSDIDRGAELVVVDDSSDIPYGLDLTGIRRIANAKRMFLNGSRKAGRASRGLSRHRSRGAGYTNRQRTNLVRRWVGVASQRSDGLQLSRPPAGFLA